MPYAENDGVRLYYEKTGAGHPIIWAHEFSADFRTWEQQVRWFGREYLCITYNARGYPPSDEPLDPAANTYEDHREDLRRLMDELDIRAAHIVGLSMGSFTGLQFALKYPERVTSLVFASGGSGAFPATREQFICDASNVAETIMRDGMPAVAETMALGSTRVQLHNKDPRGWAEFKGYLAEHSDLGSSLTMRNYQGLRPSLFDYDAELRALDVPVLLVAGDEDDPILETNLFLKRTLPRAGLWIHPRTGHGVNLEEPHAFNERLTHFFGAVERGAWGARDPRATPGPMLGDVSSTRKAI